jgi:hypothetical protein
MLAFNLPSRLDAWDSLPVFEHSKSNTGGSKLAWGPISRDSFSSYTVPTQGRASTHMVTLGGMALAGGTGRWPGTPWVMMGELGMGGTWGRARTCPGVVLLQDTWCHLRVQHAAQ